MTLVVVAIVVTPAASALPPGNDNFANATVIPILPFSDSVDIAEATIEPGEPGVFCGLPRTVWYSFTPTVTTAVAARVTGVSEPLVQVYKSVGPGISGLIGLGCGGPVAFNFTAEAGSTYYLQVGTSFFSDTGILNVDVQAIPPPAHDAFANATLINALPFSDAVPSDRLLAAGLEPGEPKPSCFNPLRTFSRSVWYAFTPAATGSVAARIEQGVQSMIAAFTGGSLASLSEVACRAFDGLPLLFRADAGTTYYLQVSPEFTGPFPVLIPLTFGLVKVPDVTINQAAGQADPTGTSPINFTAVFSRPVSLFETGDVTLSGTAGATTATVTQIAPNDGTTYDISVSGMTNSGTVTASIPAGVAIDVSPCQPTCIGNTASTSTDNTVTFVIPRPTCNGVPATIFVGADGLIVGGPGNGQTYQGTMTGTPVADVIVGTNNKDILNGRGRHDLICGLDGDDTLRGGDGDDTLIGGLGQDVLDGDDGRDTLTGDAGADRFKGGGGRDTATDFTPAEGDTKTSVEVF